MQKTEKINWLKAESPPDTCRILSNVRCLSEGVDVPALDAVLFLSPRSSQVEVVQSVGRVMRNAPGKNLGYVILPVVIPHGMAAHEALNDNKVYKVVWEVLQALRSHDDRFDAFINKLDLIEKAPDKMEVIAVTDTLSPKSKGKGKNKGGKGEFDLAAHSGPKDVQRRMHFDVGELERALYARLVKKCGNRSYWEEWANDIAKIAQTHIGRIKAIVTNEQNQKEITAFTAFVEELRDDLNDSITDEEAIEMLAQHLITKPVFDALFADYSFASNNPVSQGMQSILDLLNEHRLDKEADTLEQFYASVRRRADGIDKAEGKQKIVVELYDKFFRNAFPKMTERLGIVYTPVEVVDFIIHSVNDILQEEFGQTLGSEGVHILDPFVGTGTFITRLMQSGLITPEQLPHKYKNEIHCNEIVLLAYYIAAINIEAVYHSILSDKARAVGGKSPDYEPFNGICLTDTFQMYERDDLKEQFFPDNSKRRKRQKKLDIRVIVGNPPYSAGQTNANDNNQNVAYRQLDERIRTTYAANSTATLKNALYDSYIRAIRWASDRVGSSGVVAFVTNAGFMDANTADGLRKCLANDFSKIYVFHLRGNQRTSGERSRREGGKIFGSGSRAPIAITLCVKQSEDVEAANRQAEIYWHDIGDYLTQEQKLRAVAEFGSVAGITSSGQWSEITPDKHHDWLNQRDQSLDQFVPIWTKEKNAQNAVFATTSKGILTGRDFWCFNFSAETLMQSIGKTIECFNAESRRYAALPTGKKKQTNVGDFVDKREDAIKWTAGLRERLSKEQIIEESGVVVRSLYRPFTQHWLYYDSVLNERVLQMRRIFPPDGRPNLAICVTGKGEAHGFSTLMANSVVEYKTVYNSNCFPLYLYDNKEGQATEPIGLFSAESTDPKRSDGISDFGLSKFQAAYLTPDATITKEDLFYYIYGLLHSPEYRERYKDNLSKELPRIPAVKRFEDFQAFSQAGRELAHWHLDYETVDCYPVTLDFTGGPQSLSACKNEHFYVRKMKFPKTTDSETGKRVNDKKTVIYNEYITVRDIPVEAYDYVVNGKSAIKWVMERQAVTTDKKSGIVNDANLWATETMNNAAYPLELLQRVITVSLETMKIVNSLPSLDID